LIAPGDVDERSIADVQPDDVRGYTQCHFFAGIGGWSYALRLAGWPDDRPVWTGSCPCQPWSNANVWEGGGKAFNDPRHLWPAWRQLIEIRRPECIFGEQVAAAISKGWLDTVFDELEDCDYTCGAAVLPACCVGARHERKRLWWCAYASGKGREGYQPLTRVPVSAQAALSVNGNVLARAWRALDGDISGLLHCDGLSVVMERHAIHGYGNAIVPQVAAEFIQAAEEAVKSCL
jgi:DNA (cytosine-5)-methyltransferase 1